MCLLCGVKTVLQIGNRFPCEYLLSVFLPGNVDCRFDGCIISLYSYYVNRFYRFFEIFFKNTRSNLENLLNILYYSNINLREGHK